MDEGKDKDGETKEEADKKAEDRSAKNSEDEDDDDDDEDSRRRRLGDGETNHRRRGDAEADSGSQGTFKVDREKTCPLLLRVFTRPRGHNRAADYSDKRLPPNEIQMYTW